VVVIFPGKGAALKSERKLYDRDVLVTLQKKVWVDLGVFELIAARFARQMAPIYNKAALFGPELPKYKPEKLLLMDNLDAHLQKKPRQLLKKRAKVIVKTVRSWR